MGSAPSLLSFLRMVVSGRVYRHPLIVIEFLQAENWLLKKRLRGKRIRFTDAERVLLARKAKAVGRNLTVSESGAPCGKRYLILDRDTKCTDQFQRLVRHSVGRGLSGCHLVPAIRTHTPSASFARS